MLLYNALQPQFRAVKIAAAKLIPLSVQLLSSLAYFVKLVFCSRIHLAGR